VSNNTTNTDIKTAGTSRCHQTLGKYCSNMTADFATFLRTLLVVLKCTPCDHFYSVVPRIK